MYITYSLVNFIDDNFHAKLYFKTKCVSDLLEAMPLTHAADQHDFSIMTLCVQIEFLRFLRQKHDPALVHE